MSYDRREADARYNRSEKRRARDARKRERRRADGLCVTCGTYPPRPGRVDCGYCASSKAFWEFQRVPRPSFLRPGRGW
jgi:hypothetical protein